MLKKSVLMFTLFLLASRVEAAQLKLLIAGALAEPVKKIGEDFSRKNSHKLDFTTDTTGALQNKLRSGEKAEVIIVSAPGMDALEKEKLVVPGTRVELAQGLVGVAVRAGAPALDLSSVDAFKKAMLSARSISYVDPKAGGTTGTYMVGLFQKLGIADEIRKKTVFRNRGYEVADAVAKGEAEVGITFSSELIPNKGVKVTGILPATIQLPTNYAAAIPAGAANPDLGRAFLRELKTPAAQAAMKEAGLEPIKGR